MNMKTIRNLIFDFDGTLADTAPLIMTAMQTTIHELQLPPRTDTECRATIGVRLEDVPAELWPGDTIAENTFVAAYRRIFNRLKSTLSVECFPGVLSTLGQLHRRGYRMAIASSRNRASLDEYVDMLGIAHYFTMVVGGNDVSEGKPSPEAVLHILDRCRWNADETLTIGDAPVDILMGRSAGTATVAVTYGNGKESDLRSAAPTYIIANFADIINF